MDSVIPSLSSASMRPTPEGVGNILVLPLLHVVRPASMRPTPEGVGNVGAFNALRHRRGASMRPTPEGVGNRSPPTAPTHAKHGFNEAHARRRGKFRPPLLGRQGVLASMRPTPEGVGNKRMDTVRLLARPASMRPTPEGVGNGRRRGRPRTPPRRFNEAHARRRGKLAAAGQLAGKYLQLQ